jgi:hypothetical protein
MVGALIAAAGGLAAIDGAYEADWNGPGSVPGGTAPQVRCQILL